MPQTSCNLNDRQRATAPYRFGGSFSILFLSLALWCGCAPEQKEAPTRTDRTSKQPVKCESETPQYAGFSLFTTNPAEYHDFANTVSIKRGFAGYISVISGIAMPCVGVCSDRKRALSPVTATVVAFYSDELDQKSCAAKTQADVNGAYQLELAPGEYRLGFLDYEGLEAGVNLFTYANDSSGATLIDAKVKGENGVINLNILIDGLSY